MVEQLVLSVVDNNKSKEIKNKKIEIIRERAEIYGVNTLTNEEIISLITGIDVDKLQEKKMTLKDLRRMIDFLDITENQKRKLKLIFELSSRISSETNHKERISSPDAVSRLLMEKMRYLDKEVFKIILLDTKNQVISIEDISVGSLNSSIVHPREVFKEAIKRSSASIILVHNHPSGDPRPSKEDTNITKRLIEGGRFLGIDILDHIVIGDGEFYSFKENNLI